MSASSLFGRGVDAVRQGLLRRRGWALLLIGAAGLLTPMAALRRLWSTGAPLWMAIAVFIAVIMSPMTMQPAPADVAQARTPSINMTSFIGFEK